MVLTKADYGGKLRLRDTVLRVSGGSEYIPCYNIILLQKLHHAVMRHLASRDSCVHWTSNASHLSSFLISYSNLSHQSTLVQFPLIDLYEGPSLLMKHLTVNGLIGHIDYSLTFFLSLILILQGEMLIQLGNEGIEGDDHSKPALKGTHRKHKHHQHKQRKHKVHQRDTGVVGMPERVSLQIREDETTTSSNKSLNSADQSSDRLQELNPTEEWTTLDNKDKADSLPKYSRKSKRSTHTLPQWQKALALLTLSKMAGATHPITNAESDASKQVDILDKIIHQLGEEVASKSVTSHGHHRQHPSVDTEAKKEEIETLKDIENSLVQHTNSQSDSGISHDHGSEHSHKHTQQHGHGTDSHSKLTENTVQPSLEELEGMVVQDITKAEDEGMTKKQEVQLEKEIEGLEVLEQESIKDLIKNGGSQTK